jgi:hypothetical protein
MIGSERLEQTEVHTIAAGPESVELEVAKRNQVSEKEAP